MIASKLIDTSVWLNYFFKYKHQEIIDSHEIFYASTLTIFELRKKMYKDNIDQTKIEAVMSFLHKKCLIQPVTKEIAEQAAKLSIFHNIPIVDSLIYATAKENNAQVITCDNDFRGLADVTIVN